MGENERRGESPIFLRVLSYLKPYKKEFFQVGIILLISTAIGFLQPLVIRRITDEGMLRQEMGVILRASLALGALVLLGRGLDLLQARIFADVHNDSYYTIFHQAFSKLLRLKKSYFEDRNNAEILSFLQMDVSQVSSITDSYIVMSAGYVFRIISGLVGLLVISWKLALVVMAMVPAKFFLVRFAARRREKSMNEYIESAQDFSRWFGDGLNGVDEIKLWGLFKSWDETFQEKQKKLLGLQKKGTMIDAWNGFWEGLLEGAVTILLYLMGGYLVCTGGLTIGAVFAFVSYSGYVTGPVSALINLKMYVARITPSARRLFQFLDTETETDEGKSPVKRFPPRLEFQNVAFRYTEDRPVLREVSFHVEPGEKVAVIGQNGSGKSTILNLLLRFYEPESGRVLADGLDVRDIPLEMYRGLFSVVSQEPYLFLGSIAENADLTGQADKERLEAALEISGVAGYLDKTPQGAQTQIGRNGARLSGGEKQKLAMARALLKDAPVVILDEATSGYDVESDAYLHDVLIHRLKGKSIIMITHHYHNLEGMDRVYRLEEGALRECGKGEVF